MATITERWTVRILGIIELLSVNTWSNARKILGGPFCQMVSESIDSFVLAPSSFSRRVRQEQIMPMRFRPLPDYNHRQSSLHFSRNKHQNLSNSTPIKCDSPILSGNNECFLKSLTQLRLYCKDFKLLFPSLEISNKCNLFPRSQFYKNFFTANIAALHVNTIFRFNRTNICRAFDNDPK